MVWYELRYKPYRARTVYTSGVVFKHIEDARKTALDMFDRMKIQGDKIEIWAVKSYLSSGFHKDDMFVETIYKRKKRTERVPAPFGL